jgi:hypothetical protein
MNSKSADGAPVAVGKAYDFVLWLVPKVEKFSRSYRFTIGDRLTADGLDLLTLIVEAAYARKNERLLDQANRKVNGTRYLLRLCKDLRLLSADSYGFAAGQLDEIGRMVGGWRKAAAKA